MDAEQEVAYYRGMNAAYQEESEEQAFDREYRGPGLCALFERTRERQATKGRPRRKGRQKGRWKMARERSRTGESQRGRTIGQGGEPRELPPLLKRQSKSKPKPKFS